jgi:hypothetical protein
MPIPDRSQELIQKYLDALASESELVELEQLLATDPEVAHAFAEMARLHANLQDYFRKQYKMDQVAALLNAPDPSQSTTGGQPSGEPVSPAKPGNSIEPPSPLRSTFTPRYAGPLKSRRGEFARQLNTVVGKWKQIAVAVLILVMGAAIWSARNPGGERPRLISGRLAVAGRDITQIPENGLFDVVGQEAAVIELPRGARIELVAATRAAIRRQADQFVVELSSGGGDFRVQPDQPSLVVETELGVVTANAGQFSLDLVRTLPKHISSTVSIQLPRLVVVVAQGSVTVEHTGISTTLSAGQEHIFVKPISS